MSWLTGIFSRRMILNCETKQKDMSLGDLKGPKDGKGSNFNWQLRMLQLANRCCTPVVTAAERAAIVNPPIGKMVYQLDDPPNIATEGLYIYMSDGTWHKVLNA